MVKTPPIGTRCRVLVNQYLANEAAILDLLDELPDRLKDLDSPRSVLRGFAEHLDPPFRDKLLEDIEEGEFDVAEADNGNDEDETDNEDDTKSRVDAITTKLSELPDEVRASFSPAFYRLMIRPSRGAVVFRSLLVMAVANFEMHLGYLIKDFYRHVPEALNSSEKRFTLAELKAFDSMDEAVEDAIEVQVQSIINGDIGTWSKWLETHKITHLSEICSEFDRFCEIFQRRHVIVHNAGRVSRRYRDKVGDEAPRLETALTVDAEYVRASLDELLVPAILTSLSLWRKLDSSTSQTMARHGLQTCFELMITERWEPAIAVAAHCRTQTDHGTFTYWGLQANEWHARSMLHGRDSIRSEVIAWDTSALKPIFSVVRPTLLGDFDEACDMLPAAVEAGDVSKAEVRVWPILAPLRATEAFVKYLSSED